MIGVHDQVPSVIIMRYGVCNSDLSPLFPAMMYGYFDRYGSYLDVNDPLQFTAVALEKCGTRCVIGCGDIGAFPNDGRTTTLRRRIAELAGCPLDHVILNASHSHGTVYLPASAPLPYTYVDQAATDRYWSFIHDRVESAVCGALRDMHEGTLDHVVGQSNVPMNRRKLVDGTIQMLPNPNGPTDDSLHLLVFRNRAGVIEAIGLRLSCHPVATRNQRRITADYVGAWRRAVVREFGAAVMPFFLQGAAGDLRPGNTVTADGADFRRFDHAELDGIGEELLLDTLAAISHPARTVGGAPMRGCTRDVRIACKPIYTQRRDIEPLLDSPSEYERLFARGCLERLARGLKIPQSVDYHVQTLWLDRQLALVGLDLEPLTLLAQRIEAAFAPRNAMVLGYTNGLVAYAPDSTELARGGYETTSYLFEPWSGPFVEGFEHSLLPQLDLGGP